MTDLQDDQLDAMLRGHFAAAGLDGQRGRAARAFAERVSEEATLGDDAGPFPIRRPARLMSGRTLAFVGTAMAAAVTAVAIGPAFLQQQQPNGPVIRPWTVDSDPRDNVPHSWERDPRPIVRPAPPERPRVPTTDPAMRPR